jgi:hypothetical protein
MSGALLATFAASVVAFALVMLALGIGVLAGRRPLAGSCGRATGEGCTCDPHTRTCDVRLQR